MIGSVSHEIRDESIEAKARWFRSLSLEERMDIFVAFTNLILENNPDIVKKKYVRPASDRIGVVSKADLIASKLAAGREVDLEDVRLLESKETKDSRED